MEAGIRPVFEQYTGDDPLGNVLSANLHRRHLTESQRGMVASALATMRQGARTDIAQVCAMSQEQAAKRLAVSRRTVQYACTVREQGIPELVRRAERGEISVSLAARIAKMPQEQQRRVTALDPAALRGAVNQAVAADRKIAAPPFTPNTDDIVLWANEQARALRAAGQTSTNRAIDWENVAQAIEALGKNSSSDLANCIPTVLLHLVKLDIAAWDHGGKAAWRKKIDHARNEIRRLLAAAPSLQPTVRGVIGATLDGAKEVALKQLHVGKRRAIDLAGLSYTQEQVIDDWFPELPPKQLSEDPYAAERITQTAASKVGLRAHKSTLRRNNLGGFQLIDRASAVVAGEKFDLTGGVSPNRRKFRVAISWPHCAPHRGGNFLYFRSNTESWNAATSIQAAYKSSSRAPPTIENRKVPARRAFGGAKSGPTEFSAVRAYNPSPKNRC